MTAAYEKEQKELIASVAEVRQTLSGAEHNSSVHRHSGINPGACNRLIARIEVFDSRKDENGTKRAPVKIHFVGAGVIRSPDAKITRAAQKEMRNAAKSVQKKENGTAPNEAVPYPVYQLFLAGSG